VLLHTILYWQPQWASLLVSLGAEFGLIQVEDSEFLWPESQCFHCDYSDKSYFFKWNGARAVIDREYDSNDCPSDVTKLISLDYLENCRDFYRDPVTEKWYKRSMFPSVEIDGVERCRLEYIESNWQDDAAMAAIGI